MKLIGGLLPGEKSLGTRKALQCGVRVSERQFWTTFGTIGSLCRER